MANTARFICEPLLRGVLLGLAGGAAAVVLFRAGAYLFKDASYGLSDSQEKIAFWGFTIWFGIFGLVDSTNRFVYWIRTRNQQK
jgi:hypothetical protein